jgi:hypothetical protein
VASDTLENIRKQNTPENAVLLTVRSNPESIRKTAMSVAGVTDCEIEETGEKNIYDVRVTAEPDADVSEGLFRAFSEGGFAVRRLMREEPSLEEIFIRLTETFEPETGNSADGEEPDADDTETGPAPGAYAEDDEEDADDDEDEEDDGDYSPLFGGRRR